jgi:undecaprenyl-diphosphatase
VPISSSGHTTLLAWQRRWDHDALDPAARKRFEVALHAGTTAAILILARRERATARRRGAPTASRVAVVAIACLPPALAGKLLEGPIERRLGTPATIAAALAAGSLAMAAAERRGERTANPTRTRTDARLADGVALGAAQALALIPGVSRSGATRAAARWRGFSRVESEALAADVGLPITLGALALKGREAALRADRAEWTTLGTGALAAFSATLASSRLIARVGRDRSLLPYAGYRVVVAAAVIRRLRQNGRR